MRRYEPRPFGRPGTVRIDRCLPQERSCELWRARGPAAWRTNGGPRRLARAGVRSEDGGRRSPCYPMFQA
ncbi:hypothetical protein HMPREF3150_02538 [Pseudomonas aeruginosa]|nr:hypothetical protein HMPREF3150_02538 [Pseudomonas aeruginosa]